MIIKRGKNSDDKMEAKMVMINEWRRKW